jgi:hypothetical protein
MVARKARRNHRSEPVQGSSSQPKSARGVCGGLPQNRRCYLVEPQNLDQRLGGRRWAPGTPRSFEAEDTRSRVGMARLASRLCKGRSSGICPVVLQRHIPKVTLVSVYPSLGFRGILVFRLSPYMLRGQRMAAISQNPSSFGFPIFPRISIGLA